MNTPTTFREVLMATGLPVTYYAWPENEAPELPYLIYWLPDDEDYYADGINYANIQNVRIELYSETKDFDLERLVENTLKSNGIPYDRSETYLKTEQMMMVVYTTSILITDTIEDE